MHCDASVFLQRIEDITAIIKTLDEETAALLRGVPLLRRHIPGERHAGHLHLDAVEATLVSMGLSHNRLREAVAGFRTSFNIAGDTPGDTPGGIPGGIPALASVASLSEAVRDAATTLAIVRNALDMLANDSEGIAHLALWQRELYTKAHGRIACVVETLRQARHEL